MLDIIDKYIIKLFFGYFLGSVLVLVTLYVVIDSLPLFSNVPTTLTLMMRYYGYAMPAIIYQLLPVTCLIGTLFTLSQLNKNNELVALFSMGNSLARVSAPILVIVASVGVISFWMSDRILPYTNKMKNYTWYVEIRKKPGMYSSVKNSKIWYRQKNMLFNIKAFDSDKKTAEGLSFYFFDDKWDLVQMITAKKAIVEKGEWELADGSVTVFTDQSSFPLTQSFDKKAILVDDDVSDIQQSASFSEVVSIGELRQYIKKNKESGLNTIRYEVDLQAKYGFALASFVMAFLGIPFSVSNSRSGGRMKGVSICIILAFVYWALLNVGISFANHGVIPPFVSAWFPNIFMIGISVLFLLRLKR
jgi:lipopolysaccharide export system permease protein